MRTIGVIAEYNPFHSGHRHHLARLREAFGPDTAVVCVMSGNWVQRGDAALADKLDAKRQADAAAVLAKDAGITARL